MPRAVLALLLFPCLVAAAPRTTPFRVESLAAGVERAPEGKAPGTAWLRLSAEVTPTAQLASGAAVTLRAACDSGGGRRVESATLAEGWGRTVRTAPMRLQVPLFQQVPLGEGPSRCEFILQWSEGHGRAPAEHSRWCLESGEVTAGKCHPPVEPEGLRIQRAACAAGDAESCVAVGVRYLSGDEVAADPAYGSSVVLQACLEGLTPACHVVGLLLREGKGFERDAPQALRSAG